MIVVDLWAIVLTSTINGQRPIIRNRADLEKFLTENLEVPQDKEDLISNCILQAPAWIVLEDLESMYADLFDIDEPVSMREEKIKKCEVARATFLQETKGGTN